MGPHCKPYLACATSIGQRGRRLCPVARLLLAAVFLAAAPGAAVAQTEEVTTPPANIVVPNYNGVPVGPFGGLEGSAYVARTSDPSAAWFNPAGLSRAAGAQITGSAGFYQATSISPTSFPNSGGSVQHVPNLVGFTFKTGKMTMGAAILTTMSWNQAIDSQIVTTNAGGNQERFAYSADSELSRRVAAFSVGWDNGKAWRVGAGLAFSYTSLRMVQTASDRIGEPTLLRTLLVSSRVSGSTLHLRPVFGVQAEPTEHVRVGGLVRTSGFSLYSSGSATLDGTENSGAAALGTSFFDPEAQFESKLPFEIVGGIAFSAARADVEVDVLGYSSIAPYAMFASAQNVAIYQDPGRGAAPTVQKQPFAGLTTASRAMANVSVGGHVQLFPNRSLRLHYGVASDLSPVAPEDQIFDRANLTTWTLGLSGAAGNLSYAAGVNYRGGTADNVVLRNLLSGQPVQTTIDIRTIGMIYSLAYQF